MIIRKLLNGCYELYPKIYDLDPNVGGTGRSKLISFYRFLKEADRIGKICGIVYEATEEQFKDLYMGAVAPMIVRKYQVFKGFTDNFIDLSPSELERDELYWEDDLVKVKKIILCDIERVELINRDSDLQIIYQNLEEDTYKEKNLL